LQGKVLITGSTPKTPDTALALSHTSFGAEALADKSSRPTVVSAFSPVPSEALFDVFDLGGHLKAGNLSTGQNRQLQPAARDW